MLAFDRAEMAENTLLEFQHQRRRQCAIGFEEIEALPERGRIAQCRTGDVAEHADILAADHQAAQHLHTAQHHHVVDLAHQARGFGRADEVACGQHLILIVAQARHRLVETNLALGQRHHRLKKEIDAVGFDGVLHRDEQLGVRDVRGRSGSIDRFCRNGGRSSRYGFARR